MFDWVRGTHCLSRANAICSKRETAWARRCSEHRVLRFSWSVFRGRILECGLQTNSRASGRRISPSYGAGVCPGPVCGAQQPCQSKIGWMSENETAQVSTHVINTAPLSISSSLTLGSALLTAPESTSSLIADFDNSNEARYGMRVFW